MPLQQTAPQCAAVDKHSGARECVARGHAAWGIAALGGTGAPAGAFVEAGFVCTAAAAAGRVQARAAGSSNVHTAPGGASFAAAEAAGMIADDDPARLDAAGFGSGAIMQAACAASARYSQIAMGAA